MALTLDTLFRGILVESAYVTVELPTVNRTKDVLSFGVWYRATPDAVEQFDAKTMEAPYTLTGGDPFEQAYLYIRTLPEFATATDC